MEKVGSRQVTAVQLSFAPSWLLEESFSKELEENWKDSYDLVEYGDIPTDDNFIASREVLKIKDNSDGSLRLKARLVLHGNHDKDRFKARRDSAAAELLVVHLVLCIASLIGFSVATADVKGAYMQSGDAKREIYVGTFDPIRMPRGKLRKLNKLPHGIVDAGSKWLCSVGGWMKGEHNLSQVFGIMQLFALRDDNERICTLVAKVVDDFFIVGKPKLIDDFLSALGEKLQIGAVSRSNTHTFLGCNIKRTPDASVRLSMPGYIKRASQINYLAATAPTHYQKPMLMRRPSTVLFPVYWCSSDRRSSHKLHYPLLKCSRNWGFCPLEIC